MTGKKTVEFTLKAPQANAVAVAGTFNKWDATQTPLQKSKDGVWRAKLSLLSGQHEYRFVVDGQWFSDPRARQTVANPHGSANAVIVV